MTGIRRGVGHPFSFAALRSTIQHLHDRGAAVYLGVTPRCLGHVSREQGLDDWRDWAYDPQSGTLRRSSSSYSLHFGGYQAFLLDWLTQLRDLPLTGLVIRNAVPAGLYEGFNPLAVRLFAREFGLAFDPVLMFNDERAAHANDSHASVRLPAVFWKWAGWKARERLRSFRTLVRTLRARLPHLQFGLTLHVHSVTDPVRGLIHFAEDWIDAARGSFDLFLVEASDPAAARPASQRPPGDVSEESVPGSTGDWTEDESAAVAEMVQYLGTPETTWAILPGRNAQARTPPGFLPSHIGLIYDYRRIP